MCHGSLPIPWTSRLSQPFRRLGPSGTRLYEQALAQRQQQQAGLIGRSAIACRGWSMRRTRRAVAMSRPTCVWAGRRGTRTSLGSRLAGFARSPGALRASPPPARAAMAMTLPPALREALSTLGHSLPTLWHQDTLSRAQRKALLRCLLEKVVLDRRMPIRSPLALCGGVARSGCWRCRAPWGPARLNGLRPDGSPGAAQGPGSRRSGHGPALHVARVSLAPAASVLASTIQTYLPAARASASPPEPRPRCFPLLTVP